jgi:UMF1 family MFS transporter
MSAHAAPSLETKRSARAWALYDVGNSAFATTVMAGFFPLFFKQYFCAGSDVSESTWRLGVANSLGSVVVAVLAPFLGAYADQSRAKKKLLAFFAALGCIGTFALYFIGKGDFGGATAAYVLSTIGFSGSIIFYDALIVSVAAPSERDRVSALGYALGYLGGGMLFALNVVMFLHPDRFGLRDGAEGVKTSFALAALWWALFTLPLLLRVREPAASLDAQASLDARASGSGAPASLRRTLAEVLGTLRRVRAVPQVWTFLLAYWLYIDGVDTVIRMAVDYGLSLGLPSQSLIVALLITNFVGFPAALAFGYIGTRIGAKTGIMICLSVYFGVTVMGYFLTTAAEFYALATVIGLVQGGVQALSRSLYSRLIPPDEAGEFFGFYNMLGKFAAVFGPLLMGVVGVITGSPRLSILSISVLFIFGAALLARVREPAT